MLRVNKAACAGLCCVGSCSAYITGQAAGSDPYRARLAELGSGTMLQVRDNSSNTVARNRQSALTCQHTCMHRLLYMWPRRCSLLL
jgi:hypothetical protein